MRLEDVRFDFPLLLGLRFFLLRLLPDDRLLDPRALLDVALPTLTIVDDFILERSAFIALSFRPLPLLDDLRLRSRCLLALPVFLLRLANLSTEACLALVLRLVALPLLPDDLLRPRRTFFVVSLPLATLLED